MAQEPEGKSERDGAALTLKQLRDELDAVDGDLLALAARRLSVVHNILEIKARQGQSLFDRTRERQVFERAGLRAQALGLDPVVAQSIMGALVEGAHRLQEQGLLEQAQTADGHHALLIVGGRGQMGQLFAHALQQRGHHLSVLERDDTAPSDREARVRAADMVMLAVPMAAAVDVAREIAPWVRPDALLFDINSLKSDICAAMAAGCAGEVLGTHPMFGPTVRSLRRQKVVLCPVRPGPRSAWLERELGQMGLEVVKSDPDQHDRVMAVVQVLVHFRTLVMGEALRRSGLTVSESLRFTSPIYRLELAIVGRLFAQDPALYAEIEMANPYGRTVRAQFLAAAQELADCVENGDRHRFEAVFAEVSSYFKGFSDEAMKLSDEIIEMLVSRP